MGNMNISEDDLFQMLLRIEGGISSLNTRFDAHSKTLDQVSDKLDTKAEKEVVQDHDKRLDRLDFKFYGVLAGLIGALAIVTSGAIPG